MTIINHLSLSWTTSRGRDTYGYNICRLDDRNNGQRFKCMGGGYDMVGTVFAEWLCTTYPEKLLALKGRAHYQILLAGRQVNKNEDAIYGLTYHEKGDRVHMDGACGLECVLKVAELIGLDVQRDYIAKGRRRGETIGWFIVEPSDSTNS